MPRVVEIEEDIKERVSNAYMRGIEPDAYAGINRIMVVTESAGRAVHRMISDSLREFTWV